MNWDINMNGGILIPLFSKTRYDFSFLTGTDSQETVIAPACDLIQFKSLIFMVRIHRITMTAGQTLAFALYNTLPSDEDPQEFTVTGAGAILTLAISSTITSPALLSATGSNPMAFGKLVLTAAQVSSGSPLYAEMSGCLLGRYN